MLLKKHFQIIICQHQPYAIFDTLQQEAANLTRNYFRHFPTKWALKHPILVLFRVAAIFLFLIRVAFFDFNLSLGQTVIGELLEKSFMEITDSRIFNIIVV